MPFSNILYRIWKHVVDSVRYNYGLNYILAGLLTYSILRIGLDAAWYRLATVSYPAISHIGFISVFAGFFIPLFGLPLLYIIGRLMKNRSMQIASLALGQAALLGLFISSFIKIFSGRLPPIAVTVKTLYDGFQFGLYRGGTFNGWPSSHTTVAFAMAAALIHMYPKSVGIKICALTFATLIGLGVSVNIHFLSDVVAGSLIGWSIGAVVGVDFKKMI